jgi:hypothetical protein
MSLKNNVDLPVLSSCNPEKIEFRMHFSGTDGSCSPPFPWGPRDCIQMDARALRVRNRSVPEALLKSIAIRKAEQCVSFSRGFLQEHGSKDALQCEWFP